MPTGIARVPHTSPPKTFLYLCITYLGLAQEENFRGRGGDLGMPARGCYPAHSETAVQNAFERLNSVAVIPRETAGPITTGRASTVPPLNSSKS